MLNYLNIDKSAFHRGEYVGYGAGRVWRIRRDGNEWRARPTPDSNPRIATVREATLNNISIHLNDLGTKKT